MHTMAMHLLFRGGPSQFNSTLKSSDWLYTCIRSIKHMPMPPDAVICMKVETHNQFCNACELVSKYD